MEDVGKVSYKHIFLVPHSSFIQHNLIILDCMRSFMGLSLPRLLSIVREAEYKVHSSW